MYVVSGATGHIGSAVVEALLVQNKKTTAIVRDRKKSAPLFKPGFSAAVADIYDVATLRAAFNQGERLFLLNPPADVSKDAATEERVTVGCMMAALQGSRVKQIVAQSAFGARAGEQIGDLGVLYEMEQKLAAQKIPATIIRGAYYMSNWDASLKSAREDGVVSTFYPVDMKLPMVAASDIGNVAAELLSKPVGHKELHHVEGPERFSAVDVAAAFASALGRDVKAVEIPPSEWMKALKQMGFSEKSATSFMEMTRITRKGGFPLFDETTHGVVSIDSYVQSLVQKRNSAD